MSQITNESWLNYSFCTVYLIYRLHFANCSKSRLCFCDFVFIIWNSSDNFWDTNCLQTSIVGMDSVHKLLVYWNCLLKSHEARFQAHAWKNTKVTKTYSKAMGNPYFKNPPRYLSLLLDPKIPLKTCPLVSWPSELNFTFYFCFLQNKCHYVKECICLLIKQSFATGPKFIVHKQNTGLFSL